MYRDGYLYWLDHKGIAYVLDVEGELASKLNPLAEVDLEPLGEEDGVYVQNMLRKHFDYTRSRRAEDVLRKWDTYAPKFVKVFPREYREALQKFSETES